MVVDGAPACIICARRPQRRVRGKWMSYCRECAAEKERERRGDSRWVLLTPQEFEAIMKARAMDAWRTAAAGRHHARPAP